MFCGGWFIGSVLTRLQIGVLLHVDPPSASTVNIEPLTPADWESKCYEFVLIPYESRELTYITCV